MPAAGLRNAKNSVACVGAAYTCSHKRMRQYLELLFIFSKIGLFTIGGGYAMVPLIEQEFVRSKKWIGREEFIDLLAVAQSVPGILAINMAIFVGYRLKGIKGAVATAFGTAFPSFVIILAIALFFTNFKDDSTVVKIFKGIRPAVVALIAAPCLQMAKSAKLTWKTAIIPAIAVLLIWVASVSPIYVIIAGGVGGYIYGVAFRRKGGTQC